MSAARKMVPTFDELAQDEWRTPSFSRSSDISWWQSIGASWSTDPLVDDPFRECREWYAYNLGNPVATSPWQEMPELLNVTFRSQADTLRLQVPIADEPIFITVDDSADALLRGGHEADRIAILDITGPSQDPCPPLSVARSDIGELLTAMSRGDVLLRSDEYLQLCERVATGMAARRHESADIEGWSKKLADDLSKFSD